MGISKASLYNYKNRYVDIFNALKRGKEVVDIEVENSLNKRANGYKYTETTEELIRNPETGLSELVVTKKVTKHMPPDTTAQIYWLKNRKPKQWRDRQRDGETQQALENAATMLVSIRKAAEVKTDGE